MIINYDLIFGLRPLLEIRFAGLPYPQRILINQLLSVMKLESGLVLGVSYSDISNFLTIKPAPGRKDSGAPSKQTIRNWIKSIERECGEYFKVISEGQKLQFFFPEMPKIFNEVFGSTEVNTEQNTREILSSIEEEGDLAEEVNTHLNTEVNIPADDVKKLFIKINNKTNNNNNLADSIGIKNSKQPISKNFYPCPETISRALASGYNFVTDAEVIQEFIDKNISWGSQFADYNPVYLSFLSKHTDFQQQKLTAQSNKKTLRSFSHGRSPTKHNSFESLMAEVERHNGNAIDPSGQSSEPSSRFIDSEPQSQSHFVAMGTAFEKVSAVIY